MRTPSGAGGFTLIEAVMSAAVLGMVFLVGSTLFLQLTRFNQQARARSEIQRDARVDLALIEREIAQARGRTIVIDRLDADQPPYSRMSFSGFDGRSVAFYQKGRGLFRKVVSPSGTDTTLLATGLRQALFTYPRSDDTDLIAVGLTFERNSYEGRKKTLLLSVSKVRVQNGDAY